MVTEAVFVEICNVEGVDKVYELHLITTGMFHINDIVGTKNSKINFKGIYNSTV